MCGFLLVEVSVLTKFMCRITVEKRIWKCVQFSLKLKHLTALSYFRALLGHFSKFVKSLDGTLECLYNP
jgi:hypothetical protein